MAYESIQDPFCPHLFEVHPDFSIPSNYYPASPANEEDPLAPASSMFSHAAAQQLPLAHDRGLHTDGSSVKDLRDRLVKLVDNDQVCASNLSKGLASSLMSALLLCKWLGSSSQALPFMHLVDLQLTCSLQRQKPY